MNKYIDFTDEVKEALDNNKPIVAIQTTNMLNIHLTFETLFPPRGIYK